jgi:hypothetical protein
MRHASNIKKTDIKRAITAVIAAGLKIARVEIGKDGSINVVSAKPDEADDSPLDQWRSTRGSR